MSPGKKTSSKIIFTQIKKKCEIVKNRVAAEIETREIKVYYNSHNDNRGPRILSQIYAWGVFQSIYFHF